MNFDFSDEAKELGEQARKLLAEKAGTGPARKAMAAKQGDLARVP